jgi:hypothetical protein
MFVKYPRLRRVNPTERNHSSAIIIPGPTHQPADIEPAPGE